jgi:hypothetical protein
MPSITAPDLDLTPLRAALARARDQDRTYPAALRAQVVQVVRQQQQRGGSAWAVARSLGLTPPTVLGWLRKAPPESPFIPVVVRDVARPDVASYRLVLPGGASVLGLSLDDIAALCRKVAS